LRFARDRVVAKDVVAKDNATASPFRIAAQTMYSVP